MKLRMIVAWLFFAPWLTSCLSTMTYQNANGEVFTASAWGGRGHVTSTTGAQLAYDNTESFRDGSKTLSRMATWGVFGGGITEVTSGLWNFLKDRNAIEAATTETLDSNATSVALEQINSDTTLGLAELEAAAAP